ncbi:MAG: hypothetical protein R2715_00785 [Ilumatobacteraceae bacterium]
MDYAGPSQLTATGVELLDAAIASLFASGETPNEPPVIEDQSIVVAKNTAPGLRWVCCWHRIPIWVTP